MEIKEYIEFGEFNSKELGLYLESREAPTPDEKIIIESIPGMQGVLDFSDIFGQRIFENREITYEFKLPNTDYNDRKDIEMAIKRKLMTIGKTKLFDTFSKDFHWFGKCQSVSVDHNPEKRNFIVTIVFDCYPFLLSTNHVFSDVWDNFSFNYGIASFTKFFVVDKKEIVLYNLGNNLISPTVKTSSNFSVINEKNEKFTFSKDKQDDDLFHLNTGKNSLIVVGNGEISFEFQSEVMG